ncbi:MAG: hypothetical protein COV35_05715 [Alphaproteobacteria bacterium CG11_big_fil_rev_8_21_14_0_20_39_49]|nr:MAG: hypothetical protein COV35_05715 [Alphaproteobacteria bacterium CG11_big_fil_rev_8_21_14_0_20_39_49]
MVSKIKKKLVGNITSFTGASLMDIIVFGGFPIANILVSSILSEVGEGRINKLLQQIYKYYCNFNDEEFIKLINEINASHDLKEQFFDVVQSASRTKSELAITMLAIAFCRIKNNSTGDNKIEISVCELFQDITDDELQFFKEVTDKEKLDDYQKQYHNNDIVKLRSYYTISLRQAELGGNDLLTVCLSKYSVDDLHSYIYSLKRRKMLLDIGMPSADDLGFVSFGIGENSSKFRELLLDAEKFISKNKNDKF